MLKNVAPDSIIPRYLKLQRIKMALSATDEGNSVAALAREYNINDNLLFKWIRLWQSEGRVSRPRGQYRKAAPASSSNASPSRDAFLLVAIHRNND